MDSPRNPSVAESDAAAWAEQAFLRDPISGVHISRDAPRYVPYSDGVEVEAGLLNVLRSVSDRAVGSLELAQACSDFTSRYHFSSRRANLLRPLRGLFRGRVLVVGAGCGAEARHLGESGV